MSHSTQCLGSVVPLAMLLICFVKGFGSGSLSDNGDIGDLISDYGPSNIGVSDARYWAQYWLPQTRWKFAISFQVSANHKRSEYTTGCHIFTILWNILCIKMSSNIQYHQIPNTLPSGQISPNIKLHQIYSWMQPNIVNNNAHVGNVLNDIPTPIAFQTTSNWRSSNQLLSLITNQM